MLAPSLIADRFEVDRLAGSGGMGTVYRARDRASGAIVAVKLLHARELEASQRFAREAQILAELRHPGVVRYVAHGETPAGQAYLAMEWLEGETLSQRLARQGLTVAESSVLATRVAEALAAAHRRGIVHRDLKPSNIFLLGGAADDVRVIDFGIARAARASPRVTLTGVMVGTPEYMAPEQARGERGVDARADVFSLGCVLFKCLTGASPFAAADPLTVLLRVVMEEAPHPRDLNDDVPQGLDALVLRMLSKTPADRPRDAGEVLGALLVLGALPQGRAAPASLPSPALTSTEQRMFCLVLARVQRRLGEADDTVVVVPGDAREAALRAALEQHQARLDALADGTMAVILMGAGAATDVAARAARCALAIRALWPEAPMALVMARGVASPFTPIRELIERGVASLDASETRAGVIRLDAPTAALLERRFRVERDASGPSLHGEESVTEATARSLLGRPTSCEGREAELTMLEATFASCVAEPVARAVLVTAPAGVGKSRLRFELLRRLAEKRQDAPISMWLGSGDPMRAGSPYELIASAVRRTLGVVEGEPAALRRQKLGARLRRRFADAELTRMVEFLGELVGVPVDGDESVQLHAARHDPMLMGDQIRRAWEDFLAAECAERPVLIVLEDLHWGDLPSVTLIDSALRNLDDRPFMVLALARPEVHDVFPGLWALRGVQEIRLGGLTRRAAERLTRAALGAAVPPERVSQLVERAAGNAFYLEELIRAVAEGRGDALPETVLAMVEARLEGLDPEARRVLRAGSVFGQVFWRGGVEALLGDERRLQLGEWLGVLADAELITRRGERKFPGEEELAFRHALLREAAYAMLTDEDRALGHRLAGAWLTRAGEQKAVVIAEHLERGGEPGRALGFYLRAAGQDLEGNDLAGALAHAARGVACGAAGEALGALRLLQAEAHNWRYDLADAERCAHEAMALLPRGGAAWLGAAAEAAAASGRLGHLDRLAPLADALREVEGAPLDAHVIALARAATQLLFAGRFEDADALLARLEQLAEGLLDRPAVAGRVHEVRAWSRLFAGDPSAYLRLSEDAAGAFAAAGDARNAAIARLNVAYGSMQIGAFEQAEAVLREIIAVDTRLGISAVTAEHNLGMVLGYLGKLDEARRVEAAAVAAFASLGNLRMEAGSRMYLARILALLGRGEEAVAEARQALSLTPGTSPLRPHALGMLAGAELVRGRAAEALQAAREAMESLRAVGNTDEAEAFIHLVHAEALHATGATGAARAAVGEARARLLARAQKIADPAAREGFLRRVPENARTLTLAEAWA
jgi:tetratricopeptide (TPR) repeat protein